MNRNFSLCGLLAAVLGGLGASAAAQTSYRVVELSIKPVTQEADEAYAMAIDNKGKVLVEVDGAVSGNRGETCTEAACAAFRRPMMPSSGPSARGDGSRLDAPLG